MIWLVRHAMPLACAAVAPEQWELSPDGVAAARGLRGALPAGAVLAASDERKAVRTVQEAAAGAAVVVDAGFGEVRRPREWVTDHRVRARAYVDGAAPAGWEPREQVVRRFGTAVDRHAVAGPDLVIGTHGMACSVWLASRLTVDAGAFWEQLRFPDVIIVDLDAGTWSRPA